MTTTNPFQIGDRALHRNNSLDSRPVVEIRGDEIRLEIGDVPDVWVPAANYHVIAGPGPRAIRVSTQYGARPNSNVGKITARAAGRQKASTFQAELTSDQNHESAARRMLHVLLGTEADRYDLQLVDSNDSGGRRQYQAVPK